MPCTIQTRLKPSAPHSFGVPDGPTCLKREPRSLAQLLGVQCSAPHREHTRKLAIWLAEPRSLASFYLLEARLRHQVKDLQECKCAPSTTTHDMASDFTHGVLHAFQPAPDIIKVCALPYRSLSWVVRPIRVPTHCYVDQGAGLSKVKHAYQCFVDLFGLACQCL
jgi:hypothetical protein